MPILTRAVDWGCDPNPLEHHVECASCRAPAPAVVLGHSIAEWQTGRVEAVAEAKRAGYVEVRDPEGGHFAEYLCAQCAGELML